MKSIEKIKNWHVKYLEKVESTMDEIKKEEYKVSDNIAIFCGEQLKGRGRGKNRWVSKKGNFFASFKSRMLCPRNKFILSYLIGIILYDVVKKYVSEKTNNQKI